MTEIQSDHCATGITEQPETILAGQKRARSSAGSMRAAIKAWPKLREIKNVLPEICGIGFLAYDTEFAEESELDTVSAYWEYLKLAGEDFGDRTNELELAIKTLTAILAAKPNA
ncbi:MULTISPECIES: hypothetical protein [unclassified Bradyrhizobium]|jgi:hypothetical protein|uniref:hypothetical protein n=1 Tax=unclassified Bradyrhizobium TaxID=2631580 RepID=UPI001FFA9B2F|nr:MULTISPECIES: hypothetical protein [unclassified Bradyrhizobium]MCK1430755.1 hypothetical protein [Bradyrhizobium sp. 87]MCK1589125.1 hypothetical protein [Bradyrhizobium sp. 169]MCK1663339.1 hypothetical protein [Bradyrhizobium sp. 151]UPJ25399.1 hypothetical protein IVB54_26520 [Bradyrhizobium sp. CW1]